MPDNAITNVLKSAGINPTSLTADTSQAPQGYTLNENGYLVDAQGRQYAQNADGSLSPLAESGATYDPDQTVPDVPFDPNEP
jgi:hypothetical protein